MAAAALQPVCVSCERFEPTSLNPAVDRIPSPARVVVGEVGTGDQVELGCAALALAFGANGEVSHAALGVELRGLLEAVAAGLAGSHTSASYATHISTNAVVGTGDHANALAGPNRCTLKTRLAGSLTGSGAGLKNRCCGNFNTLRDVYHAAVGSRIITAADDTGLVCAAVVEVTSKVRVTRQGTTAIGRALGGCFLSSLFSATGRNKNCYENH